MESIIYTMIIAGIGGFIGIKLRIPAGALLGAMCAVGVYNIYTGRAEMPRNFKLIAQIIVGGMIGLSFTMEMIEELKNLILPACILVLGLTTFSIALGFIMHKVTGLDLMTSLFSTSPGGLTDMSIISQAYGADTKTVALLHSLRIITVISTFPFLFSILDKKV